MPVTPVQTPAGLEPEAKLELNGSRWWVYARSPDPQDPNAQWYWNVPATTDTLRLRPATARHLPRY